MMHEPWGVGKGFAVRALHPGPLYAFPHYPTCPEAESHRSRGVQGS